MMCGKHRKHITSAYHFMAAGGSANDVGVTSLTFVFTELVTPADSDVRRRLCITLTRKRHARRSASEYRTA